MTEMLLLPQFPFEEPLAFDALLDRFPMDDPRLAHIHAGVELPQQAVGDDLEVKLPHARR